MKAGSHTATDFCCEAMRSAIDDVNIPVVFVPKFREYVIRVLDGGTSYIEMKYCPWCGKKLPGSLRDQWFTELEKLGLEPGDKNIPDTLLDDGWYAGR